MTRGDLVVHLAPWVLAAAGFTLALTVAPAAASMGVGALIVGLVQVGAGECETCGRTRAGHVLRWHECPAVRNAVGLCSPSRVAFGQCMCRGCRR